MGSPLEAVTIQHERAKTPRTERISKRIRVAIDAMVFEGLKRSDAASKAGLTDQAVYMALRLPKVLAYMNTQQGVLRTSAKARSIARIDNLADASTSDHVKLDANKFLLGIEGISPVQRTENMHVHQHVIPGLTVVRGGYDAHGDSARLIDSQVQGSGLRHHINVIGTPVPHPDARNAQPEVIDQPGNRDGQPAGTRGQK